MKVLVTGGAGYIGSHAVKTLIDSGHEPVVLDNLSRGHRAAVPATVPFEHADIRDTQAVTAALQDHSIDCVMHFAAFAYVGESVEQPLMYYDNNTTGAASVLRAMNEVGVKRFVFSSTCATYGQPDHVPITEQTPQQPTSPYGTSKLMVEQILKHQAGADNEFAFAALRYFNVAGSAQDGSIGEDHDPETRVIPVLLECAMGKRSSFKMFGDDYPTRDGTCIRDYIHVEDLVAAHVRVMEALQAGDQRFYNLGIGNGISVKELVDAVKRVTGKNVEVEITPRRPGDPAELFANADLIRNELGWQASITNIDKIVETAWRWFSEHPDGYGRGNE